MKIEGPPLESLTRRLTETPEDFLAEPKVGATGRVPVSAVVNDLLAQLGTSAETSLLEFFNGSDVPRERNRLSVILLICWLLADDWFKALKPDGAQVLSLLDETATQLAAQVVVKSYLNDADRREELVRTILARLDCRPAGETTAQAQDRLTSLSSVERERVLKASREAEERTRAIRAALAKKAADESADKWTRE
jgi:hypothetical protein